MASHWKCLPGITTGALSHYRLEIHGSHRTAGRTSVSLQPVFRVNGGVWTIFAESRWSGSSMERVALFGIGCAAPGAGSVDFGVRAVYGGGGNLVFDAFVTLQQINRQGI